MTNVQTPKGFRDFLPEDARARQFVANKVREVFERFGFEPIETPTLEYASVLMGKYGDEADKLVFRFKDRGDRELALRYDQTVPTARLLAQYQGKLPRFWRRYQIQNVFRAEKPQKGRYREFTQCDIDIFDSTSPVADSEIIACTYFAFKNVGYPTVVLKINDRKILFTTLEKYATKTVSILSIIQSVDKLEKIGNEKVVEELEKKGLARNKPEELLLAIQSAKPTDNLSSIITLSQSLGVPKESLVFTPTLARGLDYYTGMIFEPTVPEYPAGSLGGGGRYDNLIKQLGGIDTPAVGIAFGFDRMVEAAVSLNLIPKETSATQILVTVFDQKSLSLSAVITQQLRSANIATELFPASEKLDKQLKYADRKGIPYVVIQGPNEIQKNIVTLKNMRTKEQKELTVDSLIDILKSN